MGLQAAALRRLYAEDFADFYFGTFSYLLVITTCTAYFSRPSSAHQTNYPPKFFEFRRRYLRAWYICSAIDWLQGAHLWDLYSQSHNVNPSPLFVVGYSASIVSGPLSGMLGDRFGRRRCCILYCVSYACACVLLHVKDFYIGLVIGRLLSAFSQEILFTSFESYMVASFSMEGLPSEALDNIFAWMWFGNFLVAIIAGVSAQLLANGIAFWDGTYFMFGGFVAPFGLAFVCCVVAVYFVFRWPDDLTVSSALDESTPGSERTLRISRTSSVSELQETLCEALGERKVILCGLTVVGMESALLLLVSQWTDTLKSGGGFESHGYVFASFMMNSVIGSAVCSSLSRWKTEHIVLLAAFGVAVGWSTVCGAVNAGAVRGVLIPLAFASFCFVELCCGMYFPSVGMLKSASVPEGVRSSIYTLYRVPINVLVSASVLCDDIRYISIVATVMACVGVGAVFALSRTQYPAARAPHFELTPIGTDAFEVDELDELATRTVSARTACLSGIGRIVEDVDQEVYRRRIVDWQLLNIQRQL